MPVAESAQRRPGGASRSAITRLQPLTERRRRYCAAFLRAGWSVEETAWLFDLTAPDLAAAFGLPEPRS